MEENENYLISQLETKNNKIEINIYDKEEIFENCTVQVLTNTITGEVSVGWWRNE